ncbi:hypothetical protein BpHYR1_026363 [Brachionus plicatilis]|uniref:Uncharacterized protein n=1 Tax=Brachionus plicatilis TaxID=10195 RepID=A0A3M7T2X9_BRAPC|nr:hypothetical protein BpHYR1_026363 [Brachionus plicatilis]
MKMQLSKEFSKNDFSHAIKELKNCLNYQLARNRISAKFAKYFSKKYELSKRLLNKQRNISILDDNMQNKNIEGLIYLKNN